MSKQSSMLNFLTPKAKRPLSQVNDDDNSPESANKKPAVEAPGLTTPPKNENTPINGGLTPEDRKRIEENRVKAQIKRQATLTPVVPATIGSTWFRALQSEFSDPYFSKLNDFVVEERKKFTIYPPAELVFSWTEYCAMNDVKVVILGQDPYHQPRQAHGLCFSVRAGVQVPPSLQNMYKELEADIPGFVKPNHGTLIGWAKQGVLLLNATLTVRANQANSHANTSGWEKFTDAVIKKLSEKQPYLIFILWGGNAQKKHVLVDKKKHDILKAAHPSPLSAYRGFMGCKHFSQANELLVKKGLKPIDWSFLPPEN